VGNLLALEGTIDIGCAAELKAVLLRALGSGGEIRVMLGEVAYMDVTAAQLLWAAELQARRSGVVFQISVLCRSLFLPSHRGGLSIACCFIERGIGMRVQG